MLKRISGAKLFRRRGTASSTPSPLAGAAESETSSKSSSAASSAPAFAPKPLTLGEDAALFERMKQLAARGRVEYGTGDGLQVLDELSENLKATVCVALSELGFLDCDEYWLHHMPALSEEERVNAFEEQKTYTATTRYPTILHAMTQAQAKDCIATLQREHPDCAFAHPYIGKLIGGDMLEYLASLSDQYEGLRQIGDLRGMPRNGSELHAKGRQLVDDFLEHMTIVYAWLFCSVHENVVKRGGRLVVLNPVQETFEKLCVDLHKEYRAGIRALCRNAGVLSSKEERGDMGEASLNDQYKEKLIKEVISATSKFEHRVLEEANALMDRVEAQPVDVRGALLESIGGRKVFIARVEQQITQLRPWAVNWLKIQKDSLALREVFAQTPGELRVLLDASVKTILAGFQHCCDEWAVDPLFEVKDDMDGLRARIKKQR